MPRFVLLHHQFPPNHSRQNHWDLMFEDGEELLTWELTEALSQGSMTARVLPRHRIEYLEFEGDLSDGRGHVRQILAGSFRWVGDHHGSALLHSDDGRSWKVTFEPCRMDGEGDRVELTVEAGPMA